MNRAFKGIWIPKEIWLSEDLNITEKVFLVEIDSLDNDNGCFASNDYFAKFFKLSKNRCSEIIKGLEKKEYIKISYKYKPGTKQIEQRILRLTNKYLCGRKTDRGVFDNSIRYSENSEDNNTPVNNIDIYSQIRDKFNSTCKEMNSITRMTDKRKSHINQRLQEFSLEEIFKVIEIASKSDFLNGHNDKNWKANFDWIVNPNNFVKILEGNYNNKSSNNKTDTKPRYDKDGFEIEY